MKNASLKTIDELIVAVFRLNGSLVEAGNELVGEVGLTSAWWQVLGALALSPVSLTVPQIARNMGLARQSVQRIVDLLVAKSFARLEQNPHHRRAKLVALSGEGLRAYKAAQRRQRPWADELAAGLSQEALSTALEVLRHLDQKLSAGAEPMNLAKRNADDTTSGTRRDRVDPRPAAGNHD